jgi:hypothetical protein
MTTMKIDFARSGLLICTLLLGPAAVSFGAEPATSSSTSADRAKADGEKEKTPVRSVVKPASTSQEAHGVLAKKVVQLAPEIPVEKKEPVSPPPNTELLPYHTGAVQTANYASWFSQGQEQVPPLSCTDTCDVGCDCCLDPLWCHRSGVFADMLYLRPGNIDYIYAVEQTGTLPTDSPTGPTGRVGFDAALGYRLGATFCLSECSSIQASYTWFQDDNQ